MAVYLQDIRLAEGAEVVDRLDALLAADAQFLASLVAGALYRHEFPIDASSEGVTLPEVRACLREPFFDKDEGWVGFQWAPFELVVQATRSSAYDARRSMDKAHREARRVLVGSSPVLTRGGQVIIPVARPSMPSGAIWFPEFGRLQSVAVFRIGLLHTTS